MSKPATSTDDKSFDHSVKNELARLQQTLLAGIGKKAGTVSLVGESHLSQVPWHPSLLPAYQVSRNGNAAHHVYCIMSLSRVN